MRKVVIHAEATYPDESAHIVDKAIADLKAMCGIPVEAPDGEFAGDMGPLGTILLRVERTAP